jgi:hypothetical protein
MVSVLALPVKLTKIPNRADFGSYLVQSHVTSNSASQFNIMVYDCPHSISILQELALKYTYNCYAIAAQKAALQILKSINASVSLGIVSCNIREHQHDSIAI